MNIHRQEVLILFDGPHLAYSPTTIQLYDELSKEYSVTIIAQDPNNYNGQKLNNRNVIYYKYYNVKGRYFYLILFEAIKFFSKEVKYFTKNKLTYKDYFFRFLFIKKKIKAKNFKRIICNDITNLFFCSLLEIKVDFLSLELCKNEHFLSDINKSIINCVIIQSLERYNYLFKGEKIKTFCVQNAPNFKEITLNTNRKCLIYAGGAHDYLGFYYCLNYLSQYKDEKMVVMGALLPTDKNKVKLEYSNLLDSGRLIMPNLYIDNDEVIKYISNYEIGFCFYNFDHPLIKDNYFNYFSAPSGKLFKYLAAGVPVVCSNILGFQFVKEFQCGILINNPDENEIRKAILEIRKDYDIYVKNSLKAARNYSFDKAILPYLEYIR